MIAISFTERFRKCHIPFGCPCRAYIFFLFVESEAAAGLLTLIFPVGCICWQKVYLKLSVRRAIGVILLAGLFSLIMHALLVVLFF